MEKRVSNTTTTTTLHMRLPNFVYFEQQQQEYDFHGTARFRRKDIHKMHSHIENREM